jgi:UTP:GlnB (protein PII) uridylyltransferase
MLGDVKNKTLERITAQIVQAADPESILLFGSQARGHATPHSDCDIALIFSNREKIRPGLRQAHRALWPRPLPLDLIGFARETFQEGQTVLAREVKKEGQILYQKT